MNVTEGWWLALEDEEGPANQNGEEQIAEWTSRRGEAAPAIGSDGALVEVDGATGQADSADEQKDDR